MRRGRPRKHKDGAARARAYRFRVKQQRTRIKGTTYAKAAAVWNRLSPAQQAYVMECVALTQKLQNAYLNKFPEEIERLEEMLEYAEQVERQRVREERTAASRKPGSMSRGLYMHDAPHGKGLLIFVVDPAAARARKIANDDSAGGGRRVGPRGWGVHIEQQKKLEPEYDDAFIGKHFQDGSRLRCYVKG